MKGFQLTNTKAQNLTEIVFKQDGFLTGLNLDSPKSDVGNTQLTVLNNSIPYRDRIEARGGVRPQTGYTAKSSSDVNLRFDSSVTPMHDNEFDEFFILNSSTYSIDNYGKNDRDSTMCYDYLLSDVSGVNSISENIRLKDYFFFSSYENANNSYVNSLIQHRKTEDDYFVRPFVSDAGPAAQKINIYPSIAGTKNYSFINTFVRIVDGVVEAESNVIGKVILSNVAELNGTVTPFSLYYENIYPDEYYDTSHTGTDDFYTHIRYYRTLATENPDLNDYYSEEAYYVNDYSIHDTQSLPGPGSGPTLDLNISDSDLIGDASRPTLWQSGYQAIPGTAIACSSSGFFVCRNENRKNEYIYCPIGSGENRKYLGWYNPLFQYGSVDGDITQIHDMGSYVIITTKNKTYYVDTVNYIEDEGQRSVGVFTPILPQSVLISSEIGVNFNQKNAFVKTYTGAAIAITSNGEIREFSGYQWGTDLSSGKVHKITKGNIYRNSLYCQAAFVNDAYYLGYYDNSDGKTKTLRLGTTEESGYGFSELSGSETSNSWNPAVTYGNNINETVFFFNINGSLNVYNEQIASTPPIRSIVEYTGDKFDKKLNKDIVCVFSESAGLSYLSTDYTDINIEIEFPEMTGSSESYFIYLLKTHFFLRADRHTYKVDNELINGYEITDNDLSLVSLSDIEFGIDSRVGETDTIVASNDGFDPTSGVVLGREVQDHRVRITLRGDSSGFQLTGMEALFKRHNRTQLDDTDTETIIDSLVNNMYCHITENLINECVGITRSSKFDIGAPIEGAFIGSSNDAVVIGTDPTIVTGPDGNSSGISLSADTILEFQLPIVDSVTKATVMYWENGYNGSIFTGWTSDLVDMYEFTGRNTSGWKHTAHVYDGANWLVYYNGVLQSTTPSTLEDYISIMSVMVYGDGEVADIRMYTDDLSVEEILFYINNIENDGGDYLNGYS